MTDKVQILKDSISPTGSRFTSFLIKFPKCLLAELNTHRMLVRNVGSSRAVPVAKMIESAQNDIFMPQFTLNQPGMSGVRMTDEETLASARWTWQCALDKQILFVQCLSNELNIHKQHANRLLEPFLQVELVLSGTEWDNFFALRDHPDAQPDFQVIAHEMHEAYNDSIPQELQYGEWHVPFDGLMPQDADLGTCLKIAIARIARVSYQTHDGNHTTEKDIQLFNRLLESRHMSPFEHVAMCVDNTKDYEVNEGHHTVKSFLPASLHKFLSLKTADNDSFTWTRNYAGFYTYRHQLEDGMFLS